MRKQEPAIDRKKELLELFMDNYQYLDHNSHDISYEGGNEDLLNSEKEDQLYNEMFQLFIADSDTYESNCIDTGNYFNYFMHYEGTVYAIYVIASETVEVALD